MYHFLYYTSLAGSAEPSHAEFPSTSDQLTFLDIFFCNPQALLLLIQGNDLETTIAHCTYYPTFLYASITFQIYSIRAVSVSTAPF